MDEPDPIRVVYVNSAFTRIWGLAVEDLYASPLRWTEAIHGEDRERVRTNFQHWLDDAAEPLYSAEYRIVRPDGELRWIRDRGTKLRDAQGKVIRLQGIAEDITQQRTAELALAESRQSRDALLEGNPSPSWLKDCSSRFVVANRAWFARHGIPVHDIAGKTDLDFFGAARDAISRVEDQCVIDTRKVMHYERKGPYADGAEYAETVKAPLLDSQGKVVGIVGISHDISARKHIEDAMHELNQSLAHKTAELSALNTELEAFSYSVSHDLRAPLRRISGFGNFLLKDNFEQLDAEGQNRLQRILVASEQMGRLIDDLLTLARISRQAMSLREVNLHGLATQALGVLAEAHPGRQIEIVIEPALQITADAGLMRVVVDNLIGNAWKFTGRCAHARIEMGVAAGAGERVYFVRDNGAGFDMNYAGKLFAPFQRLHTVQQFEGTGIGLATVKRIIARHEGRIWVDSAVDRGTTVYFTVGKTA
jgi:PAS domain S-box-containing protein